MSPLLEGRNLRRTYGGVVAVDDVSIAFNENTVTGVIGPNGSGKTTLFKMLSGFVAPTAGAIVFDGRDVTRLAAFKRSRRGLVRTFQEASVFAGRSVAENIEHAATAARLSRRPTQPIDEIIEYVQLAHVADTLAGDLSWGQSRLLGIGLALTVGPRLLLLDEPFAGLSPVAGEQVSSIIKRLKDDGISIGVIDHEMGFLLPICDSLVVLHAGKKLAEGLADDVIARADVREAYLGL